MLLLYTEKRTKKNKRKKNAPSKYLCMNENIELERRRNGEEEELYSIRRRGLFRCNMLPACAYFLVVALPSSFSFNAIRVHRQEAAKNLKHFFPLSIFPRDVL